VREQVFRSIGEEVPYAVAVEITAFREEPKHLHIEAVIWVEKEGQKAILIGKGGMGLKEIGPARALKCRRPSHARCTSGSGSRYVKAGQMTCAP